MIKTNDHVKQKNMSRGKMKKIISLVAFVTTFSLIHLYPASANLPLAFQVPVGTFGASVFESLAQPTNGTYAVVDSNSAVTNIIVCGSYCSGGTVGPNGETAPIQVYNSEAGVWYGPGSTFYDKETQLFTVNETMSISETDESGTTTTINKRTGKKFTFGAGSLPDMTERKGWIEGVSDNLFTTISVYDSASGSSESISFNDRENSEYFSSTINNSDLILLKNKVNELLVVLDSWFKPLE